MDKIAQRALKKCGQLFPDQPLELHGYLRPDEVFALSKLKEVHFHNEREPKWAEECVRNGEMCSSWVYFTINRKFLPVYQKYKNMRRV